MTDRTDDVTERSDPVLVRPYVTTGSDEAEEPAAAGEAETWPETATLPAPETPAEADTAIQPVVPPAVVPPVGPPRGHPVHWALRLLVLVLGVAVALGVAAYFVRGGGSRDDAQRGPSASLPAVNAPAPTGAAPSAAHPSSSPSRSASSSPSASASVPPATKRPAGSATAAAPTLAPPPAADRTGRVTSAGGRCLALGGLLGLDGSPIEVVNCVGGTTEQFTLATDGTLRVAGHCAVATGDASVRSGGCDGVAPGGQWRAGPNGSLVNPSTGRCLTDPGRNGATTSVAACTGGDGQRWSLP